jgi:hypothetical protein
VKRWLTAPE